MVCFVFCCFAAAAVASTIILYFMGGVRRLTEVALLHGRGEKKRETLIDVHSCTTGGVELVSMCTVQHEYSTGSGGCKSKNRRIRQGIFSMPPRVEIL